MSSIVLVEQSSAPTTPATGKVAVFVDTNGDLSWKDDAGNITKIAAAGSYTLTIPASGTAALRDVAQTFSAQQTFSQAPIAPGMKPAADSTTAIQLMNEAGTAVLTVDTTNSAVLVPQLQLDSSNYYVDTLASAALRFRSISLTLADSATVQLGGTALNGILFVALTGDAYGALFYLRGGAVAAYEMLDPSGLFSATKDTASSLNIYYESSNYTIQNKRGSSKTLMLFFMG